MVDASTGTPAAVVLKVHHSLADGVAGVATFAGLFDVTPDIRVGRERPAESDCEATVAQRDRRERRAALLCHPMRLATLTAKWLGRWWTVSGAVTRFLVRGHRRAVPGQPSIFTARRTSFSGTPGRKKDFRCLCVPLSEVKKCAKRRDASVTDFAMTVASGAIARWMEGRGEELKKDLVAFVPINVRGDGPFLALGNHISYQLVALHADVKEPAQRLAAIAADSARRASAVRTSDIAGLQRTAVALGPALLAVGARLAARFGLFNVAPPVANVMISSLPGPPFTLWLSGLRVRSIAPIGPLLGGFPLNITVLSYGDDLTFGLLGALNRVPDVARLRDYFLAEATFLLAAPAN